MDASDFVLKKRRRTLYYQYYVRVVSLFFERGLGVSSRITSTSVLTSQAVVATLPLRGGKPTLVGRTREVQTTCIFCVENLRAFGRVFDFVRAETTKPESAQSE